MGSGDARELQRARVESFPIEEDSTASREARKAPRLQPAVLSRARDAPLWKRDAVRRASFSFVAHFSLHGQRITEARPWARAEDLP